MMITLHHPHGRGVTLVEVLIVLCILGLLLGALGRVLVSGYASSETVSDQNRVQQEAQRVADAIVDRLRGAKAFTSGDGGSVGVAFGNGDTVRYRHFHGEILCDTTAGATQTHEAIGRDVLAFSVSFYTTHGNDWQVTTPSAAHAVRVSVTVGSGTERATQTSAVKLRNKS